MHSYQGDYELIENIGLVSAEFEDQIDPNDIIDRKLGYLFVKDSYQIDIKALGVVKNLDTGSLGILTGIISIKFKKFEHRDQLLRNLRGQISEEYAHLGRVHYLFDQMDDFNQAIGTIKKSTLVNRYNIEVLEFEKTEK